MKMGVLKNFEKFTGKHMCQRPLFYSKVAVLRPATLLKKRLWHRCFPVNLARFLGTSFFTEHLRVTTAFSRIALTTDEVRGLYFVRIQRQCSRAVLGKCFRDSKQSRKLFKMCVKLRKNTCDRVHFK